MPRSFLPPQKIKYDGPQPGGGPYKPSVKPLSAQDRHYLIGLLKDRVVTMTYSRSRAGELKAKERDAAYAQLDREEKLIEDLLAGLS